MTEQKLPKTERKTPWLLNPAWARPQRKRYRGGGGGGSGRQKKNPNFPQFFFEKTLWILNPKGRLGARIKRKPSLIEARGFANRGMGGGGLITQGGGYIPG